MRLEDIRPAGKTTEVKIMKIEFTTKKIEVEEAIKTKAQTLMDRFVADYPNQKITSARVLFSAERNWQIVEILVNAKNLNLHAAAKLENMHASLARAFEKLDTQMSRYLNKIRDVSVKADPEMKDRIWQSTDLTEDADNEDLDGYEFEL